MERDNRNIIITVLAIFLLASIGAAVYFAQKGPVIVGGQAGAEVCGILPIFTGQLDSGSSGGPGSFIAQDICHMVFANEKNDAAICNKIKTPEFKGQCYSMLAVKSGTSDVCAGAPSDARDRCYSQVAERMGDPKACEQIKIANERDNCISNYASRVGDGSLCKKITNIGQKDSCYMNTARNNPSLCSEISNPNMRQDCLRNIGR
ncbi:hypothetical protein A2926_00855 [Candidatus Giovannonibacteria bacterium RIFCSPLOWO2_01_FULL_44_40]|uniref:Uncharacterized protein n=1 Tax=Candidatus Giovannonibacteria bacterium RIFCSPHIGHO2_01_FULL_45_23 TaxID=1798325 RepID=A0A1F5VJ21_9BACT|nr:MAG: hypothetical protein A2834_01255 [Candidatus Giovannonibacteria bacterium RIFCSPHIGHO2_01_FULL_45_23]OGF75642.1 MAG: hypothetical protein A3C77_03355 [Candidatus Giovannonibacteria bacterium RIFCSPHIGHO2_02_FULL_45_13]OGF80066.1 MAG: hypothetical protein A2926_00855 [Candidatus Giovannonibacteria bacterium RIFCSPLOWO2_01_FULL_44_40]